MRRLNRLSHSRRLKYVGKRDRFMYFDRLDRKNRNFILFLERFLNLNSFLDIAMGGCLKEQALEIS